jgi:hypothetical protein
VIPIDEVETEEISEVQEVERGKTEFVEEMDSSIGLCCCEATLSSVLSSEIIFVSEINEKQRPIFTVSLAKFLGI